MELSTVEQGCVEQGCGAEHCGVGLRELCMWSRYHGDVGCGACVDVWNGVVGQGRGAWLWSRALWSSAVEQGGVEIGSAEHAWMCGADLWSRVRDVEQGCGAGGL